MTGETQRGVAAVCGVCGNHMVQGNAVIDLGNFRQIAHVRRAAQTADVIMYGVAIGTGFIAEIREVVR